MNAIIKFMQEEAGAVSIEYAFLAALIAIAMAAGATVLGKDLCGFFKTIGAALPTGIMPATVICA